MDVIATPTDFLGVNYYSRAVMRSNLVSEGNNAPRVIAEPSADQKTDMGWEVYPDGLRQLLVRLHRDYEPSMLYITENGCAYGDGPDASGRVHDARRVQFLNDHLRAAWQAMEEGVPLAGYFLWSIFDNFEWAHGYTKRFGVTWVDYETQERILKDSALWYRQVIAQNALPTAEVNA